jgi:hypothetical protein
VSEAPIALPAVLAPNDAVDCTRFAIDCGVFAINRAEPGPGFAIDCIVCASDGVGLVIDGAEPRLGLAIAVFAIDGAALEPVEKEATL